MLRILEVGIGLALVFTLVALICSVINEWISAILEKRGNLLWEGIEKLVDQELRDDICAHQLMQGLVRKQTWFDAILRRILPWVDRAKPSYIPTEMFVTTLLDILGARAAAGGNPHTMGQLPTTFAGLQTAIQNANGVPDHVKQALLALVNNASGTAADLAQAKKNVGDWFDAGMDRVSGWYKRWSQLVLLLASLVVAFVLGVDCIAIAKRLWTDPVLRAQIANAAEDFIEERKNDPRVAASRAGVDTSTASETPLTSDLPLTSDTEPATEAPLTSDMAPAGSGAPDAGTQPDGETESAEEIAKRKLEEINIFQSQLEALSLPMFPLAGLQSEYEQYAKSRPEEPVLTGNLEKLGWWLSRHLLGLLLTGVAASLGAPFWFDVLNRFVNLRNTGRKPDEVPAKP